MHRLSPERGRKRCGRGDGVGLLADVDRPAVPGPEVGELLGREEVAPAAPGAVPELRTIRDKLVQAAANPTDDPRQDVIIPTVSFASFWAGLDLAVRFLGQPGGRRLF